jgi:hypothetical protein
MASARPKIHAHELNLAAKLPQCRQQPRRDERTHSWCKVKSVSIYVDSHGLASVSVVRECMGHASASFPDAGESRAYHASFERRPFRTKHQSYKLKRPVVGTKWNPRRETRTDLLCSTGWSAGAAGFPSPGREFFALRLNSSRLMIVIILMTAA